MFSNGVFKYFPTWLNQSLQAVPGSSILFYISLLLSLNNIDRNSIVRCDISGEISFLTFFFQYIDLSAQMDSVLNGFGRKFPQTNVTALILSLENARAKVALFHTLQEWKILKRKDHVALAVMCPW